MYSKNDYRYYLENQLIHSDDFLAHYGVKGMKWKHRKKSSEPDKWTSDGKISREWWDYNSTTSQKINSRGNSVKNVAEGAVNNYKKQEAKNTKKSKVDIISFKDQKTGKEYKKQKSSIKKKSKNPLMPKNQKVEIVTNKKKKRSKREAKWNKQMQNYGREILAEQNKKRR